MTLDACAALLRTHDPDRFGMALAAAPADRPRLATLYALNLELARAPFQSGEPMVAEMRLQWWIDRLAAMEQGEAPPTHDVLTPLWETWGAEAGALTALAEARNPDCDHLPKTAEAVIPYIDATAGGLMRAAAAPLGAPEPLIQDQARGAGLAAWLTALPALQAMGLGLPKPDPAPAQALAREGLAALTRAARHTAPRRAAPALFPGTQARARLQRLADGADPFAPAPDPAPIRRRAALAWLALTGRWRA